jgi:molecular chaperone DnaK
MNRKEVVAVYDFGGGTFDFTVIDIEGYHFKVLTRGGDSWLGGDDFDSALAHAVANALWRATGVELQNRQVEWQRLLFACERAKRELSLRTETQIVVESLIESPKRINLRQKLGRPVLERLCEELFQRSLEICRSALGKVGLDPHDVHQVVVSGGVAHMPFVRDGLSRFFGRQLTALVNPDEAICLGAGLRAAQLSKHPVLGVGRF